MKLACFQPPAVPLFVLAVVFPMALRLTNGALHELPPVLLDEDTGQLVPTIRHQISYMGLN